MKNKRLFLLALLISVSILWISNGFSLEKVTHEYLNQTIAQRTINGFSLDSYLKNTLGFTLGAQEPLSAYSEVKKIELQQVIWRWVGEGGIKEDEPEGIPRQIVGRARDQNHFHNPLKLWDQAGLHVFPYAWQSSIVWTQNANQSPGGQWSWHDARNYFYQGLTLTDKNQRESAMANCFRALGQLMHLVQDASVPAHVRDDVHILYMYENWVENIRTSKDLEIRKKFNEFIADPIPFDKSILDLRPNSLAPIPIARIIDTDKYDGTNPGVTAPPEVGFPIIGIAEYTNANFFSEDTKFSTSIPYPAKTSADIEICEITDPRGVKPAVMRPYYIKKRDGEKGVGEKGCGGEGYRLATTGFLKDYVTRYFPSYTKLRIPALDGGVYEDYARKLLPRAVGYSAGLIEYFFRGKLQVTSLPIFYKNSLYYMRVKIKNLTPTKETMKNGTFALTYTYRPTGAPSNGSKDIFGQAWATVELPVATCTEMKYEEDEMTIDFMIPDPIARKDYDFAKFMLAFKGTLGTEEGAVIGQYFTPGEIKFEEEWDNGLQGRHPWAHADAGTSEIYPGHGRTSNTIVGDVLVKENVRYAGYRNESFNLSFVGVYAEYPELRDTFPILITPRTSLQFKIDCMSINQIPPAPPGTTDHYQALWLRFNNGLILELFIEGHGVGYTPLTAYWAFDPTLIFVDNIYRLFQDAGIPVPAGDLYLENINFEQGLFRLPLDSQVDYIQRIEVDSIRIIEEKQQE